MEPINLNRLAYFSAVVDAGSFTRAAERLGVTKTVVSQQVARLEAQLRTTLLLRTTRKVEPTEAGRLLHARCALILRDAEDAIGEITENNTEPTGMLRISAPNDYGTATLTPVAVEFRRRYPACGVELILSDARIDLIANQIDLSVRVGWLDDSSHQARRIGTFRQLLVASPHLVARTEIRQPEDLPALPLIVNTALREPYVWTFARGDHERRSIALGEALAINATPAILEAVLSGGGLAVLPDYLAGALVAQGRLIHVLPDWALPSGGIHLVYPAARFRPQKVVQFVAMLLAHTRGEGGSRPLD